MSKEKEKKQTYVLRVLMMISTVVLIILFFATMSMVGKIQGTARVVNYAGLVREKGYENTEIIAKSEQFFQICDEATGLPNKNKCEEILNLAARMPEAFLNEKPIEAENCGRLFQKSDRKNVMMGRKVSARSTDPFAWHLLGMISYL